MKNLFKILSLLCIMSVLMIQGFNCSPIDSSSMGLRSISSIESPPNVVFEKNDLNSPFSLMNYDQYYQSLLSITGLEKSDFNNNEKAELDRLFTSLSENSSLKSINSPLFLSATSVSGEVCSSLISGNFTKERQRFFSNSYSIVENLRLDQMTPGNYTSILLDISNNIYGRALTQDELEAFYEFKEDYIKGLSANALKNTNTAKPFLTSVCAAFLSSFDFMTY